LFGLRSFSEFCENRLPKRYTTAKTNSESQRVNETMATATATKTIVLAKSKCRGKVGKGGKSG